MEMKFRHTIDKEAVKNFCIYNHLYTKGDCKDYDYAEMLETVNEADDCTPQLIIEIAKDIAEHSDERDAKIDLSIGNIAYYLCGNVMFTSLSIDWQGEGDASPLFFFFNYKIEIL